MRSYVCISSLITILTMNVARTSGQALNYDDLRFFDQRRPDVGNFCLNCEFVFIDFVFLIELIHGVKTNFLFHGKIVSKFNFVSKKKTINIIKYLAC